MKVANSLKVVNLHFDLCSMYIVENLVSEIYYLYSKKSYSIVQGIVYYTYSNYSEEIKDL